MRQRVLMRPILAVLAIVIAAYPSMAQQLDDLIAAYPSMAQQLDDLRIYPDGPPIADNDIKCRNGEALKGILCNTEDCDKKKIVCQVYSEAVDPTGRQKRIQMPRDNKIELAEFAFGIVDRDNRLSIRSLSTDLLARDGNCRWVGASDTKFHRMCTSSNLVSGISCGGDFCAKLEVLCCRAAIVQPEDDDQEDNSDIEESPE